MFIKRIWLPKILCGTILFVACVILVNEISLCLERFLKVDTKVISSLRSTGEDTFMAFTICPTYHNAYKEKVLQSLGTSMRIYRGGNFTTNSTGKSPWEIFVQVTHDLEDIIETLEIQTYDTGYEKIADLSNSKSIQWTIKPYSTFGRCYSMNLDPTLTALGIVSFSIKTKLDIYIYLHHPGQFMNINTKSKVFTTKGQRHYIDLSYTIIKDTLEKNSNLPCSAEMNLNQDDCIYTHLEQKMGAKFNCLAPFLQQPPQNISMNSTKGCSNQVYEDLLPFYVDQIRKIQQEECIRPCTSMDVSLGVLQQDNSHTNENQSFIKTYLKSTVETRETVLDYTLVSMVAEIGGYTGLLLGISLADLAWFFKNIAP